MEDDWVVDSLVGFLQSPIWKFPVENFTEQNCIVFDQGGDNETVFEDVFSEYQTMVDKLVNTFTSELGVTSEQLTDACANSKGLTVEHKMVLLPLLASEDYEVFKSMMTQKNIDLEMQALMILQKQLGQTVDIYDRQGHGQSSPTAKEKLTRRDAEEEMIFQNALKLSKKESEQKLMAEDQELERLLELAMQESLTLHQASEQKRASEVPSKGSAPVEERARASETPAPVGERVKEADKTKPRAGATIASSPVGGEAKKRTGAEAEAGDTKEPSKIESRDSSKHNLVPLNAGIIAAPTCMAVGQEVSGEQAAQLWLQSAKTELENRHSPLLVKQRISSGLPVELKARERYLKTQRDRLLESKKRARAEELRQYKETISSLSSHHQPSPHPSLSPDKAPAKEVMVLSSSASAQAIVQASASSGDDSKKLTAKSSSGVLCSVIAKKLKEELQT